MAHFNLKKTTQEFISEAINQHGDKYDYSLVEYIGRDKKVNIKCCKHDSIFNQRPADHLNGQGCPICRYESSAKNQTHNAQRFITNAQSVHGDNYD